MKKLWDIIKSLTSKSINQIPEAEVPVVQSIIANESKKAIIPKPKPTVITPKQSRILDVAAEIKETSAKDAGSLVFMAKPFVQMTLPHREPKANEWVRRNGKTTLLLRSGMSVNPETGKAEYVGLPYGVIPRLLLIWITTEASQRKEKRLILGESLSEFMKKLGLNPTMGGIRGDITRLKDQLRRLLRCSISLEQFIMNSQVMTNNWMDVQIAWRGSMSWINPTDYHFQSMKQELAEIKEESWIELSEPFFNMVKDASVPLDYRIIRDIKQSPLAIDLYTWMVHRTYNNQSVADISIKKSFIAWYQLHNQFGANYARVEDFKRKVKPYLRLIQSMSRNLSLQEAHGGLIIKKK